jgi:DNA-binding XRE family transcriptional regulator
MFEVVKEAQLRPHDVAKLLGINRVTVSGWVNGHSKPHRLLANSVAKLLDALELAVRDGKLPVPHDIPRRERGHYIQTVMKPYMEGGSTDG